MNCLEFRRQKLAAPRELPAAAAAHRDACAQCAAFDRRADEMDAQLLQAISVPVDGTLVDRVLLNHRLGARKNRVVALAASIVLTLTLGAGWGYLGLAPDQALLEASIAHVMDEPEAFTARNTVSPDDLAAALAPSGAKLHGDLAARVTYLRDCLVPGGYGKHFVVDTDMGKITVITMPNQAVRWKRTLEYHGLVAAIMPATHGSYAIISESKVALLYAERMFERQIAWSA